MKLTTAIECATLTELLPLVQKTKVNLSFWGYRSIQIPGFEGSASIDLLAKRVMELVRTHKFTFSPKEHADGEEIAKLITNIYNSSDRQVSRSCCLTRLFCAIRGLIYQLSSPWSPARSVSPIRG